MVVYSMSISQIRSEFDEFLYAPIDEGSNGTLLSVLSALARLDFDPWQEAANLARMSRESATQRLASLILALPGGPLAHLDARTISARLIALLPHRGGVDIASHETLPGCARRTISVPSCLLSLSTWPFWRSRLVASISRRVISQRRTLAPRVH
jgi:hypothetical protein